MTGTKRCNPCWEAERQIERIAMVPKLTSKMIDAVPDFSDAVHAQGAPNALYHSKRLTMSERNYKSAVYHSNDFNYVITITSGAYEDYEHGALFAVSDEQQAIYVTDLLNKYSAFRTRFRETVWEWDFQYSANTQEATDKDAIKRWALQKNKDRKRFIEDNYILTKEFKVAEWLLYPKQMKDSGLANDPAEWGEDVVFAYQSLKVYNLVLEAMENLNGTEE
jgi:hypothetical protein